ncbi:MAG TPA: plastocyanin/azurin family copper-binding protein, partial [Bdellovibrionota bacterium]|nr:plastocyanin/azurin family copper-binding protein [Bdellovibrionota bacterium]
LGILVGVATISVAAPVSAEDAVDVTVTLSTKGNDVSFDQTSLQVPFGATVKLKFKNAASKKSGIEHNVAILKPGTEEHFLKLMSDPSYEMEKIEHSEDILAKTQVLGPGKTDVITFKAPAKGYYTYICLVPGHGSMLGMKGILSVR